MKALQFGEDVPGYEIRVLNEREIRAAAGLFLVLMLMSIQRIFYTFDFSLLKYATTFFFGDFLIRVLISPRFAPSLVVGRFIVRKQTPEYVGAEQKRFAWIIGLVLGAVMFVMLNVLNVHSPVTGLICFVCQVFLLFESVFGICLGCKVYAWVKGEKARYCPGEVCELKDRQPIQQTSGGQWAALVGFLVVFAVVGVALQAHYAQQPALIMGMKRPPPPPIVPYVPAP